MRHVKVSRVGPIQPLCCANMQISKEMQILNFVEIHEATVPWCVCLCKVDYANQMHRLNIFVSFFLVGVNLRLYSFSLDLYHVVCVCVCLQTIRQPKSFRCIIESDSQESIFNFNSNTFRLWLMNATTCWHYKTLILMYWFSSYSHKHKHTHTASAHRFRFIQI